MRHIRLVTSNRKKELRQRTPFPNALRLRKQESSQGIRPMFPGTLSYRSPERIPLEITRDFDTKRLIGNVFSERPTHNCQLRLSAAAPAANLFSSLPKFSNTTGTIAPQTAKWTSQISRLKGFAFGRTLHGVGILDLKSQSEGWTDSQPAVVAEDLLRDLYSDTFGRERSQTPWTHRDRVWEIKAQRLEQIHIIDRMSSRSKGLCQCSSL